MQAGRHALMSARFASAELLYRAGASPSRVWPCICAARHMWCMQYACSAVPRAPDKGVPTESRPSVTWGVEGLGCLLQAAAAIAEAV